VAGRYDFFFDLATSERSFRSFFRFWFCLRPAGKGRDSVCRIGWHRASGLFSPALRRDSGRELRSLAWLKRRLESGRWRRQRRPCACNIARLAGLFYGAQRIPHGLVGSVLRCGVGVWLGFCCVLRRRGLRKKKRGRGDKDRRERGGQQA